MTVKPPLIEGRPQRIDIGSDRIEVRYPDGSLLIDGDAGSETGLRTVDFFRLGRSSPFVVTDDRFRADARRWGSVRDTLAGREESQGAQRLFTNAALTAQTSYDAFRRAVEGGNFKITSNPEGRWELHYVDLRTGGERVCRFSPEVPRTDGRLPRFDSLILEEDGLQIAVSDESLLAPLRPDLDSLYRRLIAANRAR